MNVIPGTDLQTDTKSAFAEYFDGVAERAAARKAEKAAEKAVEGVQAEAKEAVVAKPKKEKQARSNDKKLAAQKLFEANADKGNGEIARLISSELEITYANAYYYVTRVFR